MQIRLDDLPRDSGLREFLATYQRTTAAVGTAILDGVFEDPDWVEEWDVAFARLYLDALDAQVNAGEASGVAVPRPWRLAFDAPADLPALRQVLLGINAHVNYDLPQALLAVITDEDFADPARLAAPPAGPSSAIDGVLSGRVAARGRGAERGVSDAACSTGCSSHSTARRRDGSPRRDAGEGLARHPRAARRTARRARRVRRPAGRARGARRRRGSPTCWRPARCCSGSRSPASAWCFLPRPELRMTTSLLVGPRRISVLQGRRSSTSRR